MTKGKSNIAESERFDEVPLTDFIVSVHADDKIVMLVVEWAGTMGEFIEGIRSFCGPFDAQEIFDRRERSNS